MTGAETAERLLQTARVLVRRPDASTSGVWPRAAAYLCRQALEETLASFWSARAPSLRGASMKAQLACLPSYLGDAVLAGQVAFTWSALSNACHHHAYELAPTAPELEGWIESVQALRKNDRWTQAVSS